MEEAYKELWNTALRLSALLEQHGVEHDVEELHSLAECGMGHVEDEQLAPYPGV